ncbi:unnamed protein product [Pleuronectes platessa]|uniref:Uncharacterized protein n=1 Tax=Pleuronectes platessa TaxID=8262 RepID=A0A9N7TTF4_PLEPL|nr:unnamed protein product [Pleuronectes platessa]
MAPVTPTQLSGIVSSMSCPPSSLSLTLQLLCGMTGGCGCRAGRPLTRRLAVPSQSAQIHDGMGNLHLNQDGIRLEGISEFLLPLYVNEIQSRKLSLDRRDSTLSTSPLLVVPPNFLSPHNSALSGPPIGRKWAIGCLSAPRRPHTTLQEITDDCRGETRVPIKPPR